MMELRNGGNNGSTSTPQIFDAALTYRYNSAIQFTAGKFKVPVGLELLQADRDTTFNERSLATDLVPSRDLGFDVHGDLLGGVVNYTGGSVAVFPIAPDGGVLPASQVLAHEGSSVDPVRQTAPRCR